MQYENKQIALFLLVAFLLIIYHEWIFHLSIITKGDWNFYFKETLATIRIDYFSLWLSDFNLGRVLVDVGQSVTYASSGALGKFFDMEWSTIERIVYFFPTIFVGTISSYILIKDFFKNNIAAIVGSFVYSFNTYLLTLETGHLTLATAFAFGPLVFYLFHKALIEKTPHYIVLAALVFFISSSYEPRAAYVLGIILFFYGIWHIILHRQSIFREIIPPAIVVAIFILLNFYWIFGLIHIENVAHEDLLNRSLWGGQYYEIVSSMTLFHPWWTGGELAIFEKQSIPFYFFFLPFFAFLGLFVKRKNSLVLFSGFISLLGILLTKQQALPFPFLYLWLFEHVPGFIAFREASKFYFLIMIGYSVLISAFVAWMWDEWKNKWIGAIGKSAITFFIAFLFLWNTKPFITGEIKSLFVPRHIPQDYLTLKNYILSQNEYYRTLWVPIDSRWGIYTDSHSKLSEVGLTDDKWKIFTEEKFSSSFPQKQIIDPLIKIYSPDLLSSSAVKYVIVPLQDTANDDDFFVHYGGREDPNIRQWYIDELDTLPYLKKIDIGTEDLVVYENEDYKPYIFSLTDLAQFSSLEKLEEKYAFIKDTLHNDFTFTLEDPTKDLPAQSISEVFENITPVDISSDRVTATSVGRKMNMLFIDSSNTTATVDSENNTVRISPHPTNTAEIPRPSILQSVLLPTHSQYTFQYTDPEHLYENAVPNPSFEDGFWSKQVGDCNNYDDNPILNMQLSPIEKTDGDQSLQLEVTRHIACTNVTLSVEPGKKYFFSFDYQSSNANEAGYYLGFNDKEHISINERIPIVDDMWHTFTREIIVSSTTSSVRLYAYSYSTDNKTNIITRYDNFHLVELPENLDDIWFVSDPGIQLTEPQKVTFEIINPTKKLVHIQGASTPFYLAMSESYHPQWQLQMNNEKVHGFFKSWWPFVKPDRVADEQHFELNGFLNGWYVDVDEYCRTRGLCTENADGTYDIELVVEFFPQRWFYLGLLVSGTTLLGCLGYLAYDFTKRKKEQYDKRRAAAPDFTR